MKKTDIERNKGLKIAARMSHAGTPDRFGSAAGAIPDRREQRKLDQAQGLVPFAVKLNSDLIKQIQTLAQEREMGLNECVAELLKKGLGAKELKK